MPEKETRAKSRRERIEVARSRDILDVASELNMELVQSGRDYRWKEHDSLVISPDKNLWKWFSRNLGGDVISLVETIKETDFNQSVNFLNDGEFKTFQRVERSDEPFNYYLKPYEQPFFEARNYLREERGLSDDTIDFFFAKGVLAQANAKLNNSIEPVVVFKTLSSSGGSVFGNSSINSSSASGWGAILKMVTRIFNAIIEFITGFPSLILIIIMIVCIVLVIIKLVARCFELTCLVALSPIFFATLVGEESKRYFRKFMSAFLTTAGYIAYVAIVYAVGTRWVAQATEPNLNTSLSSLFLPIISTLPRAIIIIACCRVMVKPPKVLLSLTDGG